MQEKKNKRLLVLLLILSAITIAFYWWSNSRDQYTVDPLTFKNFDLKSVDRILLKSKAGDIQLQADDAQWKVNEKHRADPDMIDVLFATLQQQEPKRPLPDSQGDSIAGLLESDGVHVQLYSKDLLLLDFFCGGNVQKTQAFFKKAGSDEVYLMNIPGYRVYVSGIFELPESGYRDKYIFGFNWRNFKTLEAKFEDNKKNFTVEMDGRSIGISGIEAVDTARLNDYLDAVSLLTVDDYVQDSSGTADLEHVKPLLDLKVMDIANREYTLQLYPDTQGGKLLGYIHGREWVRINQQKLVPIVRPRQFFVRQ